jgi:hypothetical protein
LPPDGRNATIVATVWFQAEHRAPEVTVRNLIEFPVEGGGTVVVEVDEAPRDGAVRRGLAPAELVSRADQTVEAAFARVRPAATALVESLHALARPPDQIEVSFGIRLSGEAGAFIAKTAGEANFGVVMRWTRPPPDG